MDTLHNKGINLPSYRDIQEAQVIPIDPEKWQSLQTKQTRCLITVIVWSFITTVKCLLLGKRYETLHVTHVTNVGEMF